MDKEIIYNLIDRTIEELLQDKYPINLFIPQAQKASKSYLTPYIDKIFTDDMSVDDGLKVSKQLIDNKIDEEIDKIKKGLKNGN